MVSGVMGLIVWQLRDRVHVLGVIAVAAGFYTAAVLGLKIINISEFKAILRSRENSA
jgi:hypothetical protein